MNRFSRISNPKVNKEKFSEILPRYFIFLENNLVNTNIQSDITRLHFLNCIQSYASDRDQRPFRILWTKFLLINDLNDHRQKHLLINLISKRWPFRREIYAKFVKNLKLSKTVHRVKLVSPFQTSLFPPTVIKVTSVDNSTT